MADKDDVNVKFGADIEDLKAKVDQVQGMFKTITERFAALAAVVAGGEAFKKFIDQTNQLNGEALKLSKILGITGEAAGILNTALGDIGADADTYTGAFLHFNRQLRTSADEMKAMGVDVNALRSGQKDSNTVFLEAVRIVQQYKPGIDQVQASMKLFGRSVEDVYKLQKLTNEKLAEAAEKNRALNLTITQEGLAATKAYKEGMNDVGDVLRGVSKTIGEAVIPHFTAMAKAFTSIGPALVEGMGAAIQIILTLWDTLSDVVSAAWDAMREVLEAIFGEFFRTFGEGAPSAMEIFKAAITVVQRAIVIFGTGLRETFSAIGVFIELLTSKFRTMADVARAALNWDWDGVKRAWQDGTDRAGDILQKGIDKAVKIALEGQAKLEKIDIASLGIPKGTAAGAPKGGNRTAPIGKNTGEDPRLAAMLAFQKAQQEASLHLQLEYLKEAGDIYDNAFRHNLISVQGYYDARLAIETRANELEISAKRQELADAQAAEAKAQAQLGSSVKSEERRKHETEVIKFKTEQVKLQGVINVLEAQGLDIARKNAQERADAERKITEQMANTAIARAKQNADHDVSAERAAIEQMRALRQVTAQQAFDMQKQQEDRSYQATVASLQAKRALIQGDNDQAKADRDNINLQIEAAEQQHQERLTQLEYQAVQDRKRYEVEAYDSLQGNFSSFFSSLADGTKTIAQKFKDLGTSIEKTMLDLISKRMGQQLMESLFPSGVGGSGGGGLFGGLLSNLFSGFSLPSFDVGTSFVPHDMVAQIHQGERITTARDNANGNFGGRAMSVIQNFTINGPADQRSQAQIAGAAARGLRDVQGRGFV